MRSTSAAMTGASTARPELIVGLAQLRLGAPRPALLARRCANIAEYTLWVVPAQMALGLFMAVIVNQRIRARPFFRERLLLPVDRVVRGDHDNRDLHPQRRRPAEQGAVALRLRPSHCVVLHDDDGIAAIAGLNAWTTSGTMMLFYLASLQAIPNDVYEAAAIDGAGPWRTFWKITFPLLKPATSLSRSSRSSAR